MRRERLRIDAWGKQTLVDEELAVSVYSRSKVSPKEAYALR
jgi:hypothetical protein